MKAKDYAEHYKPLFANVRDSEEQTKVLVALLNDLMAEAQQLIKCRQAKTDAATASILKELNDRWNKIVRLAPEIGLKRNGFKAYCMSQYGDALARYWS